MLHAYLVLAGVSLVAASVYPTQPVQATVWSADQPMLVSWVDDWKYPTLSDMGPFDIWLWRDTNTCLARLAEGVDPTTGTQQVTVPGTVLRPGSIYTLRFTTHEPINTVIYSADFGIEPANTTTGTMATQSGTATGTGTSGMPTSMTGSASRTATVSDKPSGVPPPSGTMQGNGAPTQEHRVANGGRRGVDVEKLKFRFVFVIWPVLMGITMAL